MRIRHRWHFSPKFGIYQVRSDFGPDSVDQSKSKHFTTQHNPEAEGQLNVAAWPRSKDSLFANGNENERYLVTSTDLMCVPCLFGLIMRMPVLLHNPVRYGHAAGNLRAHDTLWQQSTIKNRSQRRSPWQMQGIVLTHRQGGTGVCPTPH
jgi:hypothetical protein